MFVHFHVFPACLSSAFLLFLSLAPYVRALLLFPSIFPGWYFAYFYASFHLQVSCSTKLFSIFILFVQLSVATAYIYSAQRLYFHFPVAPNILLFGFVLYFPLCSFFRFTLFFYAYFFIIFTERFKFVFAKFVFVDLCTSLAFADFLDLQILLQSFRFYFWFSPLFGIFTHKYATFQRRGVSAFIFIFIADFLFRACLQYLSPISCFTVK